MNERAISVLRRTVSENPHIAARVSIYLSDGLAAVPEDEHGKWDLVVANPPHFTTSDRSEYSTKEEQMTIDAGWQLHHRYYRDLPPFLACGGR